MISWPVVQLNLLTTTIESGSRPSGGASDDASGVPSIGGEHVTHDGAVSFAPPKFIPRSHYERMTRGIVRAGDVLVVKDGATTGKTALFPADFPFKDVAINEHIFLLRVLDHLLMPSYLASFLNSFFGQIQILKSFQGAAIGGIKRDFVKSVKIPLPSLSEQQRIMEILHETEKVRHLRAEAEAKAAELIPAIFHQRFADHQGTRPLHKFADVVSGVAIGRKMKGLTIEVPYLRVANVQAGFVDLTEIKTTTATEEEIMQFALKKDDVLLTEGGDFDKLGRGCLWEGQVEPCIHQNHVFRVRAIPGKLNSHFLVHYLQSARAKQYFLRCAKKTTNLASINLTQLNALPVPDISIEDQERFELEIRVANECNTLNGNRSFIELTSSLSAHAFSGQLTTEWREANKGQLAAEIRQRDEALKDAGAALSKPRLQIADEIEELLELPTYGIYTELNQEQRYLLQEIRRMVRDVRYVRYFSAQQLGDYVKEGLLHKNQKAIEGHLAVFAARGIIIPVSREQQTEDTGEFLYGNAYRLPLRDYEPRPGEEGELVFGDNCRLNELERLKNTALRNLPE